MPRALWTGSLSFGLVNIPVGLYPATDSHQLEFHQFDSKTKKRIRHQRVAEGTDDEIPYQQIVDGYEIHKGEVVLLTDDEMAAAAPKKSRTLDLEDFVPIGSIDPISWSHTYYVAPDDSAGAQKAYAVLRDAMEQMKRVGIGRFVMRAKQHLATLRPFGKGMALETMFFADEIRDIDEVLRSRSDARTPVSAREIEMAKKLIGALATEWDHGKYEDTFRDELLALIKQKAKGGVITGATPEPRAKVIDLMAALKESLGQGTRKP